jgi:hypothetical protein
VEKKKIYIKVQIDRATNMLTASTSYVRFQNGLSKAIVSIRKQIWTFSTGGQLVAGRCLYSNDSEVNNVKDSFLPIQIACVHELQLGFDPYNFRSSSVCLVEG